MNGSTQVKHHGKFAYTLPMREEEDSNETVDNGSLVTAVRMVPDENRACLLLADVDRVWAEGGELARHNTSRKLPLFKPRRPEKTGTYIKDVRPGHDAQVMFI